mgnify:FL=1
MTVVKPEVVKYEHVYNPYFTNGFHHHATARIGVKQDTIIPKQKPEQEEWMQWFDWDRFERRFDVNQDDKAENTLE